MFDSHILKYTTMILLYERIDQTLVNSLHGLLNCENRWIRLSCYYITV